MVEQSTYIKFETFYAELDEAIIWLESIGLKCNGTRISQYKDAIRLLVDLHKEDDISEIRKKFRPISNALYEANETIIIYKALSLEYTNEIKKHLQKILKGPIEYTHENPSSSSNEARNIAFELATMALLVLHNFKLDFTVGSDVAITFNDGENKFIFECKRPQAENKVEKNVRKARSQLRERYKQYSKGEMQGLISLDISKLINEEFNLFVGSNEEEIIEELYNEIRSFIEKHQRYWQSAGADRTIAVLLRLYVLAINKERNGAWITCSPYVVNPINESGEVNIQLARRFSKQLGAK